MVRPSATRTSAVSSDTFTSIRVGSRKKSSVSRRREDRGWHRVRHGCDPTCTPGSISYPSGHLRSLWCLSILERVTAQTFQPQNTPLPRACTDRVPGSASCPRNPGSALPGARLFGRHHAVDAPYPHSQLQGLICLRLTCCGLSSTIVGNWANGTRNVSYCPWQLLVNL